MADRAGIAHERTSRVAFSTHRLESQTRRDWHVRHDGLRRRDSRRGERQNREFGEGFLLPRDCCQRRREQA